MAIDWVKIQNFKCFDELELQGLTRVNLVGGKNNVGKTALLEAIELVVSASNDSGSNTAFNALARRLRDRHDAEDDIANSLLKESDAPLEISTEGVTFSMSWEPAHMRYNVNSKYFSTSVEQKYLESRASEEDWNEANIIFVSTNKVPNKKLMRFYKTVLENDYEGKLNDNLRDFDERIESLKLIPGDKGNVFKIKTRGLVKPILLNAFGEGMGRFITLLCAIWAAKDGYLFIDEIENGIHFRKHELLWGLLFKASNDANCQIFATTHSKECMEAFYKVQQENVNAGAYFELARDVRKDQIFATRYDYEKLGYSLSHNLELRGE